MDKFKRVLKWCLVCLIFIRPKWYRNFIHENGVRMMRNEKLVPLYWPPLFPVLCLMVGTVAPMVAIGPSWTYGLLSGIAMIALGMRLNTDIIGVNFGSPITRMYVYASKVKQLKPYRYEAVTYPDEFLAGDVHKRLAWERARWFYSLQPNGWEHRFDYREVDQ